MKILDWIKASIAFTLICLSVCLSAQDPMCTYAEPETKFVGDPMRGEEALIKRIMGMRTYAVAYHVSTRCKCKIPYSSLEENIQLMNNALKQHNLWFYITYLDDFDQLTSGVNEANFSKSNLPLWKSRRIEIVNIWLYCEESDKKIYHESEGILINCNNVDLTKKNDELHQIIFTLVN